MVYDNLASGFRQSLPDDVPLVRGDLLDRLQLADCFDRHPLDAVLHMAGIHDNHASIGQPHQTYEINVLGSMNLIGEAMKHGVNRVVFRSTCAVYGPQDDDGPIGEDANKHPITPFGRTKWVVEMALQDCARSEGLGSIAMRNFNVAGAAADGTIGESHRSETHIIPAALRVALGLDDHVTVCGVDYGTPDGSAIRDFVHVEDVAEAHALAIEHVEPGQALACNVGTAHGTSVLTALAACRRITAHDIPAQHADRREGDIPVTLANHDLAEQRLGWCPGHDVDHMITTAWNWHRSNPDGFDE